MSSFGVATVSGPTSIRTEVVQASLPAVLEALANERIEAIYALIPAYQVIALSLASAGQGGVSTLTITAALASDITQGGFASAPDVRCFLAADRDALARALARAVPTSGAVCDVELAGSSPGAAFMGMVVRGTPTGGGASAGVPLTTYYFVDTGTLTPEPDRNGFIETPFLSVDEAVTKLVDAGIVVFALKVTGFADPGATLPIGTVVLIEGMGVSVGDYILAAPPGPQAPPSAALRIVNAFPTSVTAGGAGVTSPIYIDAGLNSVSSVEDALGLVDCPEATVTVIGCGIFGPMEAAVLNLVSCAVGGSGSPSITCAFLNATSVAFQKNLPITVENARLRLTEFDASLPTVTNVNPIELDSYTDARFTAASGTATGGVTVIG